jgi:integrase
MSVYKSPKSPFYQYDFQVGGNRFHGTTKARSKREAEAVEREIKKKAQDEVSKSAEIGMEPLTFDVAVGRFWTEKGQYRADKSSWFTTLKKLVDYFGKEKRLSDITNATMIECVSHFRARLRWGKVAYKHGPGRIVSNATVNRQVLEPLKSIFRRARLWGYHFPQEPHWKEHWLKEPQERVRELHAHEQHALQASLREDYRHWFEFLQLSGRRANESLIRWNDVNWEGGEISTLGKGDRRVWTPITPSIRAILQACVGHHPEYVFTFIAQRTRDGKEAGKRYPMTYGNIASIWKRTVCKAKVSDFRLHDNRHDTATKLLRQTNNLKLVQRVLNHTQLSTTAKYAHVMDEEVASALEANAKSRKISRS